MNYVCAHLSNTVNAVGLVFDIVGALLIWKYGIPEISDRTGKTYLIEEGTDEAEKAEADKL